MGVLLSFVTWVRTLYTEQQDAGGQVPDSNHHGGVGCLAGLPILPSPVHLHNGTSAQRLRQDPKISRVQIPRGKWEETRVVSYMNDLSVLLKGKGSIERVLQRAQVYGVEAGAKLNMRKRTYLVLVSSETCWPWESPSPTRG